MMAKRTYTREELLADHEYVTRNQFDGKLFHGGYDAQGVYHSPRTLYRWPAIQAWQQRLESEGHPYRLLPRGIMPKVSPNVAQVKFLLQHNLKEPLTFVLTAIGMVEGFGNLGIQMLPAIDFQQFVSEDLDGTAIAHLHNGLFEAHGMDEAGNEASGEYGHDHMWYVVRDLALNHPQIPDDMLSLLPVPPPPTHPRYAEIEQNSTTARLLDFKDIMTFERGDVDPLLEIMVRFMSTTLVLELLAESTFEWAKQAFGNPAVVAHAADCKHIVECIQRDEQPHVAYLETALAELRVRTLKGTDGSELPGRDLIDPVLKKMLDMQTGERNDKVRAQRLKQIEKTILEQPNGHTLLAEFSALGDEPTTQAAAA
jgi:hypothetical protein